MADEVKLRQQEARGRRAASLLDDELVKEAFRTLEDSYISAWKTTGPMDEKAREKLYLAINVVGKVRDHLQLAVQDGNLAKKELDQLTVEPRKRILGIV